MRKLVAFAAASMTASCIAVFGLDPLAEGDLGGDASDAPDAPDASDIPDAPGASCPSSLPDGLPRAPALADDPPSDGTTDASAGPTYAITDIELDPTSVARGFDLDGRPANDGCTVAQSSPSSPFTPRELERGVDNAMGQMLAAVPQVGLGAFGPEDIRRRLREGRFGFVLRVDDWNGTPDDPHVKVFVIPTIGYGRPRPNGEFDWGTRTADGGFAFHVQAERTPLLDAGDLLVPDGQYLAAPGTSDEAWIVGGQLVARFASVVLPFRFDNTDPYALPARLQEAVFTGTFSDDGVRGSFGGRLDVVALLQAFGPQLFFEPDGTRYYACNSQTAMTGLRGVFCGARDIAPSRCEDGRGGPCGALSFGGSFVATRVSALGDPRFRGTEDYPGGDSGLAFPTVRCGQFDTSCP